MQALLEEWLFLQAHRSLRRLAQKMDEAEVNKRIEAHEAWLASSPTK